MLIWASASLLHLLHVPYFTCEGITMIQLYTRMGPTREGEVFTRCVVVTLLTTTYHTCRSTTPSAPLFSIPEKAPSVMPTRLGSPILTRVNPLAKSPVRQHAPPTNPGDTFAPSYEKPTRVGVLRTDTKGTKRNACRFGRVPRPGGTQRHGQTVPRDNAAGSVEAFTAVSIARSYSTPYADGSFDVWKCGCAPYPQPCPDRTPIFSNCRAAHP